MSDLHVSTSTLIRILVKRQTHIFICKNLSSLLNLALKYYDCTLPEKRTQNLVPSKNVTFFFFSFNYSTRNKHISRPRDPTTPSQPLLIHYIDVCPSSLRVRAHYSSNCQSPRMACPHRLTHSSNCQSPRRACQHRLHTTQTTIQTLCGCAQTDNRRVRTC